MRAKDDGSTPVTAFVDPAELAEAVRKARETAHAVTETDEHRALGVVVSIKPVRKS